MHAGIHNFELHSFRAAFQMVLNYNLVLLHANFNFLYVNDHTHLRDVFHVLRQEKLYANLARDIILSGRSSKMRSKHYTGWDLIRLLSYHILIQLCNSTYLFIPFYIKQGLRVDDMMGLLEFGILLYIYPPLSFLY